MNLNYRVSMEYPYQQNETSSAAVLWREAIDNLTCESFISTEEYNSVLTECQEELKKVVEAQEQVTLDDMALLYGDIGGSSEEKTKLLQVWRTIMDLSNLARCYGAVLGIDARQFGLAVLFDSLGE